MERSAAVLTLFGEPAVIVEGVRTAIPKGISSEIAVLLAEHPVRPWSTDALLDILWDEVPGSGRNALQRQVSRLRAALRPLGLEAAISSGRGSYCLNTELIVSEGQLLEQAINARGVPVSGPPDETGIRWWLEPLLGLSYEKFAMRRHVIEEQAAELALRWASAQIGASPHDVAQGLMPLVRRRPYDEQLSSMLLEAARQSGAAHLLLSAQTEIRDLLNRTGLTPTPRLASLLDNSQPTQPRETPLANDPQFVGRMRLVGATVDALEAGRSVQLHGAPGVGTSRVLAEALRELEPARVATLISGAKDQAEQPYSGLLQLRYDLPAQAPANLADFFLSTWRTAKATTAHRLIVPVDDAQWLDPASSDVLASAVELGLIVTVVSVRAGTADEESPLLARAPIDSMRLEVPTLVEADAVRLAESVCGHPLSDNAASELWQLSSGHPLYLTTLVRDALDSGTITINEGVAELSGTLHHSSSIERLVGSRVDRLPSASREALELTVLADGLTSAEAERLGIRSDLHQLRANGLAEQSDLAHGRRWVPAHPMVAEWIRDSIDDLASHIYHRLFVSLAGGPQPAVGRLRLLHWRIMAGIGFASDEEATENALFASASGHPHLALSILDRIPKPDDLARLTSAGARFYGAPDSESAEAAISELRELTSCPDEEIAVQAAIECAVHLGMSLGRPYDASEVLKACLGRITEPRFRMLLLAKVAKLAVYLPMSSDLVENCLVVVDQTDDPEVLVNAAAVSSMLLAHLGRVPESLRMSEIARGVLDEAENPSSILSVQTASARAWSLLCSGDSLSALREIEYWVDRLEAEGAVDSFNCMAGCSAAMLQLLGQVDRAERLVNRSIRDAEGVDVFHFGRLALLVRSIGESLAGQPDKAERTIKKADVDAYEGELLDLCHLTAKAFQITATGGNPFSVPRLKSVITQGAQQKKWLWVSVLAATPLLTSEHPPEWYVDVMADAEMGDVENVMNHVSDMVIATASRDTHTLALVARDLVSAGWFTSARIAANRAASWALGNGDAQLAARLRAMVLQMPPELSQLVEPWGAVPISPFDSDVQNVVDLAVAGRSTTEIAAHTNLHESTIRNWLEGVEASVGSIEQLRVVLPEIPRSMLRRL